MGKGRDLLRALVSAVIPINVNGFVGYFVHDDKFETVEVIYAARVLRRVIMNERVGQSTKGMLLICTLLSNGKIDCSFLTANLPLPKRAFMRGFFKAPWYKSYQEITGKKRPPRVKLLRTIEVDLNEEGVRSHDTKQNEQEGVRSRDNLAKQSRKLRFDKLPLSRSFKGFSKPKDYEDQLVNLISTCPEQLRYLLMELSDENANFFSQCFLGDDEEVAEALLAKIGEFKRLKTWFMPELLHDYPKILKEQPTASILLNYLTELLSTIEAWDKVLMKTSGEVEEMVQALRTGKNSVVAARVLSFLDKINEVSVEITQRVIANLRNDIIVYIPEHNLKCKSNHRKYSKVIEDVKEIKEILEQFVERWNGAGSHLETIREIQIQVLTSLFRPGFSQIIDGLKRLNTVPISADISQFHQAFREVKSLAHLKDALEKSAAFGSDDDAMLSWDEMSDEQDEMHSALLEDEEVLEDEEALEDEAVLKDEKVLDGDAVAEGEAEEWQRWIEQLCKKECNAKFKMENLLEILKEVYPRQEEEELNSMGLFIKKLSRVIRSLAFKPYDRHPAARQVAELIRILGPSLLAECIDKLEIDEEVYKTLLETKRLIHDPPSFMISRIPKKEYEDLLKKCEEVVRARNSDDRVSILQKVERCLTRLTSEHHASAFNHRILEAVKNEPKRNKKRNRRTLPCFF